MTNEPSAPHRLLSRLIGGSRPWMSHALIAPAALWLGLFLVMPLGLILVISFAQHGPYGAILWHWTPANYARAVTPTYLPVLLRSLAYAAATTVLTLACGFPLAYYLTFFVKLRRNLLLFLLMIPFWTSSLISIYSWMILLGREGLVNGLLLRLGLVGEPIQFLNTSFAVILGLTYFYLPFMIFPLYSCLEKMPVRYIEAAKDLGAGPWTTLWKITLPLALPGICAGTILTFIPCVGDFLTAEFLGGPRTYLIGNLIESQFLTAQDWPYGSALSILLILPFVSGIYFYLKLESPGIQAGRV